MSILKTVMELVMSIKDIHDKLDQIHILVNSNLTAANRSELAALESQVRLAKEIIGLKRASGIEPSQEIFDDSDIAQAKIDALKSTVRDRMIQEQEIISASGMVKVTPTSI